MPTLLLVEDDDSLATILLRELGNAGYEVIHGTDGLTAIQLHTNHQPDAVILDWMLPDVDGITVLKHIRKTSPTPILMLTAKSEEEDRIEGIEVGADDYITKPFSMRELLVRIQALLRRVDLIYATLEQDRVQGDQPITYGNLTLDPSTYLAMLDGETIELSPTEFHLLYLLMANPGRTFTRAYLMDAVWNSESAGSDRAVDNAIRRIRSKIGAMGEAIESKWGVGYRWRREHN